MVVLSERLIIKVLVIRAKVVNVNSIELFTKNILFMCIQKILIIPLE